MPTTDSEDDLTTDTSPSILPPPRRNGGLVTFEDLDRAIIVVSRQLDKISKSDPTTLTTQLVDKAVAALKEDLNTRFSSMAEATKLVHDQHTQLVESVPIQLNKSMLSLREYLTSEMGIVKQSILTLDQVSKERFLGISIQFEERDKRTEQLSQTQKEATNALSLASSTAVAAALQAQKESAGAQNDSNAAAVAKSEAAFTKQIDQITVLVQQIQKGNDDKNSDLKAQIAQIASRLDRGEGNILGVTQNRSQEREIRVEQAGSTGNGIAVVAAVISGLALLITIGGSIIWFAAHSGQPLDTSALSRADAAQSSRLDSIQRQLDRMQGPIQSK